MGIQFYSGAPRPFPKGDNYEIAKIHWQNLQIFSTGTNWPISSNPSTKHLWVKEIQVCLNEGPHPFLRGDNYEISEIQKKF